MEKPKRYDPKEAEQKWQKYWEEEHTYAFDKDSDKPIYSVDTPPPTMSGRMHIGHALSYSQQDFMVRFHRMNGKNVFYPFGTDDNGLPTERLVEKERKVKSSRMERQEFIDLCMDYLKEARPQFIQDWKNIGMSCDFNICYSTIDDHSRKIAQKSFLQLAKKNRVYRKEAPVIWDPVLQTAIAQAELVNKEVKSHFNDIVFKCEGEELIIATTRPELLGACVAVFAHPEDERYKHLFGKTATSPLYNAEVPILPDEKADPEKGTGIVMCCTFGDQTDIEWYKKHNLPLKMVLTKDGKMTKLAGKYEGMQIKEARAAIIEDLKANNLLKDQREIVHIVNVGERSGAPIEILNSKQWYVKYLEDKEYLLKASEELEWFPLHMKHRLDNWIKGLSWDWSISRQRHFGIPIPVWYDNEGNEYYPDEDQLPVDPAHDRPNSAPADLELTPETDVFDTWFTSGSSPHLAVQLMPEHLHDKLFPMNLRPQGHDIINFWLFYTMTKSRLIDDVNPWNQVAISGFVLDPKGNKMSKSKGNTVSPEKVLEKYPADAMRFWAAGSKLGEDLPYQEKDLVTGVKTINKLWNATKFAFMNLEDFDPKSKPDLQEVDAYFLYKLDRVIEQCTEQFEKYEYAKTKKETDKFFWQMFCDNYLEIVKDRVYNPDRRGEKERQSAQYVLYHALYKILRLFAPIMPHVTEEIYQTFYRTHENHSSIHRTPWPTPMPELTTFQHEQMGETLLYAVNAARRAKSDRQVSLKTPLKRFLVKAKITQAQFNMIKDDLKAATATEELLFEPLDEKAEADFLHEILIE